MILFMTHQIAVSRRHSGIDEFPGTGAIGRNHRDVKVDEVAVVRAVALRAAHAMGIVADPTRGRRVIRAHIFNTRPTLNVYRVLGKTLIIEDAGLAVALVA